MVQIPEQIYRSAQAARPRGGAVDVVTIAALSKALGIRPGQTTNCRVCQVAGRYDQTALSFGIGQNGQPVLFCHRDGCSFQDQLAALGFHGTKAIAKPTERERQEYDEMRAAQERVRALKVQRLWDEARQLTEGDPAWLYLEKRGIDPREATGHGLACHYGLWCPEIGATSPALLSRFQPVSGGSWGGAIRTWIDHTGAKIDRRWLGACSAQIVVCKSSGPNLVIGEGVETVLAYATLAARHNHRTAGYSALAAGSSTNLGNLRLPKGWGRHLLIAADNDDAGLTAAHKLRATARNAGWDACIDTPITRKTDFNDQLRTVLNKAGQ